MAADKPKARTPRIPRKPPSRYHHGNLREALIAATLKLIAEGRDVSIREAARLAGVSPAAPFRHFPDKASLMRAVAQRTITTFREALATALRDTPTDDPIAALRVMSLAYLGFARSHPEMFRAFTTASDLGFLASDEYRLQDEATVGQLDELIRAGQAAGVIDPAVPAQTVQLAGRALLYGLVRMEQEGQLDQMGIADHDAAGAEAVALLERALRPPRGSGSG
ncbi:MAG: TetR/AcrR family transcriptional regulator [Myxococcota bacterium]